MNFTMNIYVGNNSFTFTWGHPLIQIMVMTCTKDKVILNIFVDQSIRTKTHQVFLLFYKLLGLSLPKFSYLKVLIFICV